MKKKIIGLSGVTALLASALVSATVSADLIAFDMNQSASQNLIAYNNDFTDAFSSAGDGFQIYQRGESSSIPFAVLDDTISVFPSDSIGIIDENNTDTFFGVVDTVNNDTSGPVMAEWIFDVSGFSDLSMAIDMAAMGDFENSDTFNWSYSLDDGPIMSLFDGGVDEAASLNYTLASGVEILLNDPMQVNGVFLSNELSTIESILQGSGSMLSIFLTANANGGSEAFAFQNLLISGNAMSVSEPSMLALLGLGLVLIGVSRRRT